MKIECKNCWVSAYDRDAHFTVVFDVDCDEERSALLRNVINENQLKITMNTIDIDKKGDRYTVRKRKLDKCEPDEIYSFVAESPMDAIAQFDKEIRKVKREQVTDAGYDWNDGNCELADAYWTITTKSIDLSIFGFGIYDMFEVKEEVIE